MATITFKEAVKDVEGKIRFAFGAKSFELAPGDSYETDDPALVSDAATHPYLQVDQGGSDVHQGIEAQAREAAESDDPHVNPRADHLAAEASPEAREAAAKNLERIQQAAAGAEVPQEHSVPQPPPSRPVRPESREVTTPTEGDSD